MWLEAQRLFDYVDRWVLEGAEENSSEVAAQLAKFKERILNITKNKPRSKLPNDSLKPGTSVKVDGTSIELDPSLCNEAETISMAFDIHQLDALQIVLAGEIQVEHFCTLPRGLLAVVCYYDYHRFLALTLQAILRLDSETVPDDLKLFVENSFVNIALFKHLLQVQATFSIQSEFIRLSQPEINGLGGTRHQLLLRTIIEELSEALGGCLYSLCGWAGDKAKEFAAELYPLLKAFPVAEKLENGHMAAWTSLIRLTSPEVLTKGNVTSNVLTDMVKEIRNETIWSDQSLCGTIQMACAISLRTLAVNPSDHLNIVNVEVDVDRIVDRAVQNHAFKFLRYAIIGSDTFVNNASYLNVVDAFLKKLISNFPAKLLEIERDSEDELTIVEETAAKGQMIAPNLHYATFLGCLSDLYFLIDSPKLTESKKEELISLSRFYSPRLSIELARFLERSRIVCHPIHAVAYLEFERAVCRTQETAAFLFDVFARVPPDQDTYIGWEQLMSTLRIYEQRFRQVPNTPMLGVPQSSQVPEIPQHELAALISWITLANRIAHLDPDSAEQFIDNRSWSLIDCANGLVSAPTPIQFKGALLSLLAALAQRESGVMRIWHSLNAYQICRQGDNGALYGLQQELEERECPAKRFDVTLGMVQLLKSLFSYGSVPEFASPYITFLVKSVLSQMSTRSYEDVQQLWEIAENALDAVYALVRHGYTDTRAVVQKDQHIQLLAQLLNDTPVFRAISAILLEDCDGYVNPTAGTTTRFSQKTAFSATRLLSLAISRHSQLRSAIRSANSDIIVANIQSMLLTSLRSNTECMLDVIFLYLDQVNEFPFHAYYAVNLLRELCSVRPSLQKTITELLKMRTRNGTVGIPLSAVWKVLDFPKIEYTVDDIIKSDADVEEASKCRGETARILLEIFCDAVDTDPSTSNICFLLFGFQKNSNGQLFSNTLRRTGYHNVVDVLQNFSLDDPLSLSYSALIEPAFRLMKRLTSLDCAYSTAVLRHLRSSDFIVNILESGNPMTCMNQFDIEETPTHYSLSRMIVGSILNLAAIETSTLLKNGHIDTPIRIYKKLFEAVGTTDDTMEEQVNSNILFSILHSNRNVGSSEVDFVSLEHFNSHKLQKISEDCKSTTSFGTPQYDIKNLHDLLKREIISTQNESAIVLIVEKEMLKVLEYFTDLNNQLLLRGAVDSLVSGCTALLNVIAIFSPVPFFSLDSQLDLLCDAAFSIIEFTSTSTDKEALPLSATLQRIVKTISNIVKEEHKNDSDRREVMGRILVPLLELMIKPIERPFQSKVALYESARLCLQICKTTETEKVVTSDWLQENKQVDKDDDVLKAIDRFAYDLNQRIVADISDMTIDLKVHPLLFLGDLLREDSLGSKKVASFFSKSGMPRYLVDLLATLEVDWTTLSRGEQRAQADYKAFNTIMSVLIRLAFTDPGWTILSQMGILEIVTHLPMLNKPPSEIFLQPMSVNKKGSAGNLFSRSLDLLIHLCFSLCSKPKWKRLSYKTLEVVKNLAELLGQLIRAEIKCDLLSHCAELVYHIWECDDETRKSIDSEPILNSLRKLKAPKEAVVVPETKKVDFSAPTSLLKNLFPSIRI